HHPPSSQVAGQCSGDPHGNQGPRPIACERRLRRKLSVPFPDPADHHGGVAIHKRGELALFSAHPSSPPRSHQRLHFAHHGGYHYGPRHAFTVAACAACTT